MPPDEMRSKPEGPPDMTRDRMIVHIRAANAVARNAVVRGHHPFGAVLVGPDDRILMRQGNISTVRHAETELARRAADTYPPEFLWSCTLVSTGEPCAMCTGTLYWTNIGRLVYGYEESKLLALTGDHSENPTKSCSPRTGTSGSARQGPESRSEAPGRYRFPHGAPPCRCGLEPLARVAPGRPGRHQSR